jgi:HSP20 family protein
MRYRRSSYRYAAMIGASQTWIVGDIWRSDPRLLAQNRWRPDVDAYETTATFEIVVDLAGVEEDDFEVQLFENALVVEGDRRLAAPEEAAMYHTASIRQGPFRVEVILPKLVDAERVEAHYDRGILRISLPKRAGAR